MQMIKRLFIISLLILSNTLWADQHGQKITYSFDETTFEGFLATPDNVDSNRPVVLIIHDWMGLKDLEMKKAEQLADMGYVAFAVDMYGQGVRPKDTTEAGSISAVYREDRSKMRAHIAAAYKKLGEINPDYLHKVVAMGYCFGGTVALELARYAVPLAGTVSFHGGLTTPTPEDAKLIQGKVIAFHGAKDPYVPTAHVCQFMNEMIEGNVDLTFISYPDAVHAFTNPTAGDDPSSGVAYNAAADKDSWAKFTQLLEALSQAS